MPNPRQRRKVRSGNHSGGKPGTNALRRLHNREKKVADVQGPTVLREGWDKTKTVRQNYKALGLLTDIPLPKSASSHAKPTVYDSVDDIEAGPKITGYGQIIRDAEGNIIDVIIPDDEEQNEDEDEMDVEGGVSGAKGKGKRIEAKTEVVKALETLSATVAPVIRFTSDSEHEWLLQMVMKYGDDTERMFKDRKINVWQKTEGEIKRMLKKAGGVNYLRQQAGERSGAAMEV